MNLTNLPEKKLKRIENRRRKLSALVNIIKLNDQNRQQRIVEEMSSECLPTDSEDESSGDEVKSESVAEEPTSKRHKLVADTDTASNTLSSCENSIPLNFNANTLTMEDYARLKYDLHQRKIYLTKLPRIRVRDDGEKASIGVDEKNKIPLFMKDIQHMLAYFLFGPYLKPYNSSPRWCLIEKFNKVENVSLIVVEGLTISDYLENPDQFQFLNEHYSVKVEVINSFSYDGDIVSDISAVCLSDNDRSSLLKKFGSDIDIVKNDVKVFRLFKPAFPVTQPTASISTEQIVPDKFPRTCLLLSLWQLVVENYPVPIKGELSDKYTKYRLTKEVYKEVTDSSPLFAMDCEMCLTTANENELTRITIVNEKSEVVYESLVKPRNKIINYLTKFSGITEEMLRNVEKRLEDVQNDIIELLPADAILVGHSLNIDLHALKLMHPYVIDTSVIYNMSGERWRKPKLQTLAWEFLELKIQKDSRGHDSVEDSISSLKLVQLKLSQDVSFGDAVMFGKQHLTDKDDKNNHSLATSIFNSLCRENKKSIIIGHSDKIQRYEKFVTTDEDGYCQSVPATSNKRVIRHAAKAVTESKFTLAHLHVTEENKAECISRVDRWCSKIWSRKKENSASMVLFAGCPTNNSTNGVCFVEVKKPFVAPRKPKLDN